MRIEELRKEINDKLDMLEYYNKFIAKKLLATEFLLWLGEEEQSKGRGQNE